MSKLLTSAEVAARLKMSEANVRRWRYKGGGPPFTIIGNRLVRYERSAVDAFAKTYVRGQWPDKKAST